MMKPASNAGQRGGVLFFRNADHSMTCFRRAMTGADTRGCGAVDFWGWADPKKVVLRQFGWFQKLSRGDVDACRVDDDGFTERATSTKRLQRHFANPGLFAYPVNGG